MDVIIPLRDLSVCGLQQSGPGNCSSETQVCAQVVRRRIQADACPVPEGQGEWCKLRTEAPVNGGRNYNGPKVPKSLVG